MSEQIQSTITNLRVAINAGNNQRAKALLYELEQEVMNEIGDKDQRIETLLTRLDQAEYENEPWDGREWA